MLGAADISAVSTASRRAAGHPRTSGPTSTGTVHSAPGATGRPAALRAASAKTCPVSATTCHGTPASVRRSAIRALGTIFPRWLTRYPVPTASTAATDPTTRSCMSGCPASTIHIPSRAPA